MEITEHWVGKAAGGKVLKEARSLVRLGRVTKVVRKDGVFQGELSSGAKPRRVVVKVLGPIHVKNLCNCAISRATGAMCEHAAAVILAGIQADEVKKAPQKAAAKSMVEPMVEPKLRPLEVRLSPKFPHEGIRAVNVRRVPESTPTTEPDYTLGAWLFQNTGKVDATMLSLPENKVGGFYRSVSGHERLKRGDKSMSMGTGTIRPVLELEVKKIRKITR